MSSAAANYHDSAQFIHQRYADTAHIIFEHQQKLLHEEKRRQKQSKHSKTATPNQQSDFSRYGNYGVVAKETSPTSKSDQSKPTISQTDTHSAAAPPTSTQTVKSNQDTVDHSSRPVRRRRPRSKVVYVTETNV